MTAVPEWLTYTLTGGLGAGVAWLSLRLNGALVWRTNAEGYQAELERVQREHAATILRFEARIAELDARLRDAQDMIRDLQAKTDVTRVAKITEGVEQMLRDRTPMFDRITENTERIEALERDRAATNARLFAELEGHVFPAIDEIHRAVVMRQGPTGPQGERGPRGKPGVSP